MEIDWGSLVSESTSSGVSAFVGPTTVQMRLKLWIITKVEDMNIKNGMMPVHPGEILREEMEVLNLSANYLSKALRVPVNRITLIFNDQRGVSADKVLRLARYFGTTPNLWLNLQKTWKLRRAEVEISGQMNKDVKPRKTAA